MYLINQPQKFRVKLNSYACLLEKNKLLNKCIEFLKPSCCHLVLFVSIFPQGCSERPVSESHGKTYSGVWRLRGPYVNSSVPHEQRYHGMGLQGDVPWKINRSQLSGETFIEVGFLPLVENISYSHINDSLKKVVKTCLQQRSAGRRLHRRDQHASSSH